MIVAKNSPKAVISKSSPQVNQGGSVKKQMESYLGKIFDQEGGVVKPKTILEKPSATESRFKQLEKCQPFTVDKRDMSFKSKVGRDPMDPPRHVKETPIPGAYCPDKPRPDLTQSKNYQ